MADLIRYTPEILAKINKLRLGGMSWQRIGLQLNPPASEHAVRNAAMSHQLPCMSVSKDDLKLWVGDRLAKLRVAWPHFTVVELAAQFKCTPNAITGAAHRNGFPAKDSPIKSGGKRSYEEHERKFAGVAPARRNYSLSDALPAGSELSLAAIDPAHLNALLAARFGGD